MADVTNQNLADSIAMLEQILEVMPQDIDAIKALYNAYLKGGRSDRAYEHLKRLVEIVADRGDADGVAFVQAQLKRFEAVNPSEVAAYLARLRVLEGAGLSDRQLASSQPAVKKAAPKAEADISEELALAWRLYEESQLSQEEYSSVLHDLTEVSTKDLDVPVSVLHVLEDRGFTQMNRIMGYLSSRSGVPFIELARFELNDRLGEALPMEFPVHQGALPFAFFGNDLLIGVLNPFNKLLVDKAENECGHRCHTFLVGPEDYNHALAKLRALAA